MRSDRQIEQHTFPVFFPLLLLCIVFDFDLKYIYSIHSSEIKRFRLNI